MEVETLDSKVQHDSEEQTEGHSVRSEVGIKQATSIQININRITHTNNINKDTSRGQSRCTNINGCHVVGGIDWYSEQTAGNNDNK